MTEIQKFTVAMVRLAGVLLALYGILGFAWMGLMAPMMGNSGVVSVTHMWGMGVAGAAWGAVLTPVLAGAVLFVAAPVLARLVTFDLD